MHHDTLREKYLNRANDFSQLASVEEKRLMALSLLRLLNFIGGIILIWFAFTKSQLAGYLSIMPLFLLFLFLLKKYSDHSERKAFLQRLSLVNRNESGAMSGDLSPFDSGFRYADPRHFFSGDVDLFGRNSLFQYLNRTVTGYGRDILAGWLADPYPLSAGLPGRQEVVREMSLKENWRHRFMAAGMKKPLDREDIAGLVAWMNESPSLNMVY